MPDILIGADIFDGLTLHKDAALMVADGLVAGICPVTDINRSDHTITEFVGGTLAPGLIDLQVNGGGGQMLSAARNTADIAAICAAHLTLGTTGLLPTLITDQPEVTARVINLAIATADQNVPGFIGLHLEGPHLDPRRKGAHDAGMFRPMSDDDLALILRASTALPVLKITVAPEAVSSDQTARLSNAGIIVSIGHSETSCAAARAAIDQGASCVTHLFNAMSQLGNRAPGLVGATLDTDVYAGIIADGVHVADECLRLALRAKSANRLFLVSDAMAVAGTDLDEFMLGHGQYARKILRAAGRLTLQDGTLAGADVSLPQSIAYLVSIGAPLIRALAMATSVPANLIGCADTHGHLRPKAVADIVYLRGDLTLGAVWQAGIRQLP
jgi:N-acetylglucosamine-6-phosphate deacetylase